MCGLLENSVCVGDLFITSNGYIGLVVQYDENAWRATYLMYRSGTFSLDVDHDSAPYWDEEELIQHYESAH